MDYGSSEKPYRVAITGEAGFLGSHLCAKLNWFWRLRRWFLILKSGIELKPLSIDHPRVRRSNISKGGTILDWEPKVSIEEGLSMTIKHFKDRLVVSTKVLEIIHIF